VCDIVVTFCRAIHADSGALIARPATIRTMYLSSGFYLDILSRVPLDLVLHLYGASDHIYAAWLRLPRLIAPYALMRKRGIHSSSQKTDSMLIAILRLLSLTALVTHFYACVWWLIGTQHLAATEFTIEQLPEPYTSEGSHWVFYYSGLGVEHLVGLDVHMLTQYCFSFYWVACTLSTASRVGYSTPKNEIEILFTIVCMLTTLTFYAYVMGALWPPSVKRVVVLACEL
jgi:Ion transport protein